MTEPATTTDTPSAQDQLLDEACAELEEAVRNGTGRAEDWLQRYPTLALEPQAAVGLVYREFSVRSILAQQPSPDEYYERFPALRRELEEQFQIHAFLAEACSGMESPSAADPVRIGLYDLEMELGRGATGVVYQARHRLLDRVVALKVLPPSVIQGTETDRFLIEARAVSRLQHPNIVQLFEAGESDGRPYLALEFVSGGSVANALGQAPMSQRAAAELVAVAGRAVAHAHARGILHRDLKPGNILLAENGAPKIADFGLAKLIDRADGPTQPGGVIGTPGYMAPEQAVGNQVVGPEADVYGLGAILYELLTGRPPFRAESSAQTLYQVVWHDPVPLARLQPDVKADLAVICAKCLEKDPHRRYATADALADDLERFLAGQPILARPSSVATRFGKWAKRHPLHVVLAAVVGLAAAALVAGGLWSNARLRAAADEADRQRAAAEAAAADARTRLEEARRLAYSIQLSQVNDVWRTDPNRAVRLLDDTDVCPLERRDFTWGLFTRLCRTDHVIPTGQTGGTRALACTADGLCFAAAAGNGTVHTWDAHTGRLAASISASERAPLAIAFSPESRVLTATASGSIVRLRSVRADDDATTDLAGHTDKLLCAAFASGGEWLATGSADRTVRLWRIGVQQPAATIRTISPVKGIALSADGRVLLTIAADGTAHTYDLRDVAQPRELSSVRGSDNASLSALALSHDGATAAVAESSPRRVLLFDVTTGMKQQTLWGHTDGVTWLDFSPDGRYLVSTGNDHTVRLWNVAAGTPVAVLASPHQKVRVVRFAASTTLVAGGDANELQVWGLADRIDEMDSDRHSREHQEAHPIVSLACASNGRLLAAGTSDGRIEFRKPGTLDEQGAIPAHKNNVLAIAFSGDSRLLATGGLDGQVTIVDAVERRLLATLAPGSGLIRSVSFSPDGSRLATAGNNGEVKLWDTQMLKEVGRLPGNGHSADAVAYSADGRWLAIGYADGRVRAVETNALRDAAAPKGHHGRVLIARFSPDGRILVTGGTDRTVRLWDVPEFTPRAILEWREGYPFAASFTPDGRTLAVGGGSRSESHVAGEVVLWDVATGHRRAVLTGQAGPVAFMPDGRALVTATHHRRIKWWPSGGPDSTGDPP